VAKVRKMPNKIVGEYAELCFLKKAASLGLVLSKPYGDSMPYDMVVDNGVRLHRVQVKSTGRIQHGAFHIMTSRVMSHGQKAYTASDTDFLAAYVLPQDAWYLIPIGALSGQQTISLYTHSTSRSQWEKYREAWHLLLPKPSARRIFAQADSGAWDDLSGVIDEMRDEPARYTAPYICAADLSADVTRTAAYNWT
jgi:hypothetical protein